MDNSFKNVNYEDRKDVLEKTKNTNLISKFFKGRINFDYELDSFYSDLHFQFPQIELTEKYGILFSLKGGSSAINCILKKFNLSELNISTSTDFVSYIQSVINPNKSNTDNDLFKEIDLILNGKSKKDLIIVTRNPVYKFLSGLYQDTTLNLQNSQALLQIVSDKYNIKSHHLTNAEEIAKLSTDAICFVAYTILNHRLLSSKNVCSGHTSLLNEFYYLMLINNKINNTKLKIVDIDDPNSDLVKCMGDYNPEILLDNPKKSYWTHRGHHEMLLNGIEKICLENNNMQLLHSIKTAIINDFYYYTLIRHHYKKYIYKN